MLSLFMFIYILNKMICIMKSPEHSGIQYIYVQKINFLSDNFSLKFCSQFPIILKFIFYLSDIKIVYVIYKTYFGMSHDYCSFISNLGHIAIYAHNLVIVKSFLKVISKGIGVTDCIFVWQSTSFFLPAVSLNIILFNQA